MTSYLGCNKRTERVGHLLHYTMDSEASMSWFYPLLGIYYFATHRALYETAKPVLIKVITTSVGITAGLFVFTFLPQLAFCALFSGPLAFVPATVMVLGEAYLLVTFVSKAFFLGPAQDAICSSKAS